MKSDKGTGILIEKTKISDNKLIIKVLCNDSQLRSGVFYIQKKKPTAFIVLGLYEIGWTAVQGQDLVKWSEANLINFKKTLVGEQQDQYYLIAEICSSIFKSNESDDTVYPFLKSQLSYFNRDFNPEFHLYFLAGLIAHLGYRPDFTREGAYYDFREAGCSVNVPSHADYCAKDFIRALFQFTNDNLTSTIYSGSSERYAALQILIRILEVQSGVRLVLKSIDVLRDIRK